MFDDIGIGENSFRLPRSFRHQTLLVENETELVRRIIRAENLERYLLEGGSFGTVSATIVGSALSRDPGPGVARPHAVVLSGVVAPRLSSPGPGHERTRGEGLNPSDPVRGSTDRVCILSAGPKCLEDDGLALLTREERESYRTRVAQLFADSNKQPLQRLLRDALHWNKVHDDASVADFVRKRVLSGAAGDYSQLECWYREKFNDVPWLQPHRSASQAAFSGINGCFTMPPSERFENQCRCFPELPVYDPGRAQAANSTIIVYVNGDSDSQTPIEGAERHFALQRSPEKAFIRVCGAGHFAMTPGPPSRAERRVSTDQVLGLAFARQLDSLRSIDGFCGTLGQGAGEPAAAQ